jgi:hypothetical protein
MNNRRFAMLGAAVLLAAFGPFALNTSGEGGLVRLSTACGQATECVETLRKLCSTHNGDYRDWACSKGCGTELTEGPSGDGVSTYGVSTIES